MLRHINRLLSREARTHSGRRPAKCGPSSAGHRRLSLQRLEPRHVLNTGPLLISEFMADNETVLADGDGDFEDWIEIYNRSDATVNLTGWYLTDDDDLLTKWQFPSASLDAGDYLVVFASQKHENPPPGELHTNFRLDADGEYLALVEPDGATVAYAYDEFPEQLEDVSYGPADATTMWDTLIDSGAPVKYHMPTPGDDPVAWTNTGYDDSTWTDTVTLDPASLVITEVETGDPDWLEIQNVSDQSISTQGWFVAINDTSSANINDPHGLVWQLPASVAAGEVLYRTEDVADVDTYWGSEISWGTGSGWVMIVDNQGNVVDFTAWGYGETEIADMVIDTAEFTNISVGFPSLTVGSQWQGTGVPGGAGQVELIDIEHEWRYEQSNTDLGTAWRELDYDVVWPDSGKALLYHESSALPAPKNTPLTLGASTYYFRSYFNLDAHPDSVTQLDLRTVIDDGAAIYINGKEVFRLGFNEDDVITHGFYSRRTVGNATYETNTIPPDKLIQNGESVLVAGENLIAVEVHQTNATSSDVVMGLELEATVLQPKLERIGNSDINGPGDFDLPPVPSQGVQNLGLTVPFVPGEIPALTGLGFSDDADFSGLVQTNVGDAMHAANASLWSRVEFQVADPTEFDVLTLRTKYDDGYVAYLNGVKVADSNAPDPLLYDSAATAEHPDSQAVVFEETNISDHIVALKPGTNVLAIHGLNLAAADDDFLILPELIATSVLDGPQYMTTPTPWDDNVAGSLGWVTDTQFSVDRGFYTEAFDVEITTDTLGAEIRYTTDGSTPTAIHGTVCAGPITINRTTTLRAAAFKTGYIPTEVDTQTYLFLSDVLLQSPDGQPPAGWPAGPINGQRIDYGMDPAIVNDPVWGDQLIDALVSMPSMSIVTDLDNLFDPAIGIFVNAGNDGAGWERPTSVELIYPPDASGPGFPDGVDEGFQINAGLRIRGGYSRQDANPKHAFRLFFRNEYGDGKLNYPLFGDEGVDRFDKVDIRTSQNYSWAFGGPNNNTMVRDVFSRDIQGAMGQPYTRSRYYHLYLNGQYWGIFQTQERAEARHGAANLGGEVEDYDAVKQNDSREIFATDGNLDAYRRLWQETINGFADDADYYRVQGYNLDGTRNPDYERLLDVDNLIDYMIITYYTGDRDGPGSRYTTPRPNNYYAVYNRVNPDGWKFFEHDSEHSLGTGENNMVEPLVSLDTRRAEFRYFNAHWLHEQVCANDNYVRRFADRVYEHFFNDGVLAYQNALTQVNYRADQIDLAFVAESARWGDSKVEPPRNHGDWVVDVNEVRNWIVDRTDTVINQIRNVDWYPAVNPPALNRHGGHVDPGFEVTMSVSTGTGVYEDTVVVPEDAQARYFVPPDDSLGTTWTQWGFDDSSWGIGQTGIGYENSPADYQNLIETPVKPQDIHAGATSILVRIPFIVDDLGAVDRLTLQMKYDDGFVAFINGQPVARRNFNGTLSWNTEDATNHPDSQAVQFEDVPVPNAQYPIILSDVLVEGGQNVLAIHALNSDAGSSDMLILPQLLTGTLIEDPSAPDVYYTTDGSDPRAPTGEVSNAATTYDDDVPVVLTESQVIKARAYQNGTWSPLHEAEFFVGPQAGAENLVITEINYHPYEPTAEEVLAGFTDANQFEFIELYNFSGGTVDLAGLACTEGIAFDFAAGDVSSLGPGEFVVVVADQAAFAQRYGSSGALVAGQYTGSLDNGGESITLLDWSGAAVVDFAFNDGGDWPGRADGKGATLELTDALAVPATEPLRTDYLEDGDHWRSSSEYSGSPGTAGTGPLGDVVINEVLSHTDEPWSDSIELHNTTTAAVDISGWYLSDSWGWESNPDNGDYKKFRIPDGTTIPAGGYVIFDEDDFNPTPLNPGPNDFGLDGAHGDDVWLMEADAAGELVRFVDHVDFGAAANGESFGRWPNGQGDLFPMTQPTLGPLVFQNSGPRVGPVVISEVHYNPGAFLGADDLEFIEIYNPSPEAVDLTNWRIRKGVDYDFPEGTELAAYGVMVVVPFDVADVDKLTAFRLHYGINELVQLVGGYRGQLNNGGEQVQLQRPDEPPVDEPDFFPKLLEDEVRYDDQLPWPVEADGTGSSLNRRQSDAWGNAGGNWDPLPATPGSVSFTPAAMVTGRYVFYNNSIFDGNSPAANPQDDNAIAIDKEALLPGETATFANYTSYNRGINGIMIDIAAVSDWTALDADDFGFRVGNSSDLTTWNPAPTPNTLTVRPAAGPGGADRVTIIWHDYAIQGKWLEVTVFGNEDTGLADDDVFYFGHAAGETGNSASDARVNAADMLLARNNPRTFLTQAPIDFAYDFNRDARVNATDLLIGRTQQTHFLTALNLITLPAAKAAMADVWLCEFEAMQTEEGPAKKAMSIEEAVDRWFADEAM